MKLFVYFLLFMLRVVICFVIFIVWMLVNVLVGVIFCYLLIKMYRFKIVYIGYVKLLVIRLIWIVLIWEMVVILV